MTQRNKEKDRDKQKEQLMQEEKVDIQLHPTTHARSP